MPAWGSHQQHGVGGSLLLQTRPGGALVMPLPKLFAPHFPPHSHCPDSAWQRCLAQHPALNSSPPLQTHRRSLRQSGSRQCWGWLAQPAPHIPAGQPCPPAPWLKSIIQIILAWRHGSVAVTNSSEARRARAHAPLITGAGACLLPQPPPHTEPQPAPTSPHVPQIHHPYRHSASGWGWMPWHSSWGYGQAPCHSLCLFLMPQAARTPNYKEVPPARPR